MNRWLGLMMLSSILLTGCNAGPSGNVVSDKERKKTATGLRQSIKKWAPHLTLGWEVPLQSGSKIRGIWVNQEDVLVETDRHRLWQIKRKSGDMQYHATLRIGSSRETFQIEQAPARSKNKLYLLGKGYLFIYDEFMNLEAQTVLKFAPASDPSATDEHLFIGTYERFFYGYNWSRSTYDDRKRLAGPSKARPVNSEGRVYFAANDPDHFKIVALSTDPSNFFKNIWTRQIYDTVLAPLALHPHAGNLYAGSENGTLFVLSKHSGEVLWSAETGGEIKQAPIGRADRVYVIAEDGEKQGLHCIKAISSEGDESKELWRYSAGKQILAIGKKHLYVRIDSGGGNAIAVVRAKDGSVVATLPIDARFSYFLTNTHGPQIILGTQDGYIFMAYEE